MMGGVPRPIYLLIKPASGLCNLRCRHCFYLEGHGHSRGIMSTDILETVVRKAVETVLARDRSVPKLTIAFQGGEPTLAGLAFFRRLIEFQKQYTQATPLTVENAIQTNGCLIDDEWAAFLAENRFLVGLSIDGPAELHDAYRIYANSRGSHKEAMRAARLFKKHGVEFNVLTVLHSATAAHIGAVYGFFKRQNLFWQQYIPCIDPPHEPTPPWSLTDKIYGDCLCRLFDLWYRDVTSGHFVYIRFFENLVGMLNGLPPENCGMAGVCAPQIVVESDGSVYPCDFYVRDDLKLGNLQSDSFDDLEAVRRKLRFVEESISADPVCAECEWKPLCRSGCRRDRDDGSDVLGRNRFCAAYKRFFAYAYPRLRDLAIQISRRQNHSFTQSKESK